MPPETGVRGSRKLTVDRWKRGSRIVDNPSARAMADSMRLVKTAKAITEAMKGLGVKNETVDRIHQSAARALKQSDLLELPDLFNDALADQGWIATQSFAVDTMRRAVELQREGRREEAEREILDWFTEENITLFAINRSKRFDETEGRWDQLREALRLTVEERYWAAVPLILIACDGFASDVLGTSPFEKDADLSVFDSVVGHPNSLPTLIAKVTKGVRKSSRTDMTLPLRHGILHGRSLGYANRVVCMKAWLLMVALVDWACDKSTEDQRAREHRSAQDMDWGEIAEKRRKIRADRREIEAYEPRTNAGPFNSNMDPDLPESAIFKFLTCWQAQNYGYMAEHAVNLTQKPARRLAGELRSSGEFARLTRFDLRTVRQPAVAFAEAEVYMEGATPKGTVHGMFRVLALRNTRNGDAAMPTDQGRWYVQQSCMVDLMQGRMIESADSA